MENSPMRIRRNALAVATVAALSFTAVAPAQAQNPDQTSTELGSSETNAEQLFLGSFEDTESSSDVNNGTESGAFWDSLSGIEKFLVGVASATAFFTVFGMLRTLIYNIAGV